MPATPEEHWNYTIKEWTHEPFTRITQSLPPVKVLYDIGANVGGFSHVIANLNPGLKIYAWEPVEDNFQVLKEKLSGDTCFKKGIYYGAKTSRVMWQGNNIGAVSVEQLGRGTPRNDEIIELEELENFKIEKPDLIKLDVEGAEGNIIEHSRIVKECPNLIIEWHLPQDPVKFFTQHLDHEIIVNLENIQFLLCLKSR